MPGSLVFLKLGGSLITDKSKPGTARTDLLEQFSAELKTTLNADPDIRLLLGHGSGSFGHVPAKQFGTRQGVHSPAEWQGFTTVWHHAARLNRFVVDALQAAQLPAITFSPSACCTTDDGRISGWDTAPLRAALDAGLVPVVHGDVAFDRSRGGTIVSTEDVFAFLAQALMPERILIAGIEEGVWADFPDCTRLFTEITPASFPQIASALQGSAHTDVTGGMETKVKEMLELAVSIPGLSVRIFNGARPGALLKALLGAGSGTLIHA